MQPPSKEIRVPADLPGTRRNRHRRARRLSEQLAGKQQLPRKFLASRSHVQAKGLAGEERRYLKSFRSD